MASARGLEIAVASREPYARAYMALIAVVWRPNWPAGKFALQGFSSWAFLIRLWFSAWTVERRSSLHFVFRCGRRGWIDRGFVVHPINPKQLDRLRDRFSVAGAKDERRSRL
jgi:hypothetical protein